MLGLGGILAVVAALALGLADQQAASSQNAAAQPQGLESARVLFRMRCADCHGLHGRGGRSGPDLTRGTFAAGDTDADLLSVITSGVAGTEMPGFGSRLDERERRMMVAYIRSLAAPQTTPPSGDPAAGKELFWGKGRCGSCHRVGARGTALGPELTRAGRQRSAEYLRESIVDPDADVTPGYAAITVVTNDGKRIVGIEKGFDNFSARLVDLSGQYYSFQKSDVSSITREYRSLMPTSYGRLFSAHEIDDLVAYMARLRGDEP